MILDGLAEASVRDSARALKAGELVAFPTETVYGLGGDARDDRAVARIFDAKGRPRFNPLIVHVPDLAAARRYAIFGDIAEALAATAYGLAAAIPAARRRGRRTARPPPFPAVQRLH